MGFETKDEFNKVHSIFKSESETFSSIIMARQSTIGSCSSRSLYGRPSEGKAFGWETQPGKPITPPQEDILPPLSPPPAVLAMGLPKPCFDVDDEPKARKWSSAWLVKKFKKTMAGQYNYKVVEFPRKLIYYKGKRPQQEEKQQQREFESQRSGHSESARFSSSSYASTLTSSSTNSSSDVKNSSNVNTLSKALSFRGKPFTCNPRGLSDIVVYFVKKS